MLGRLHKAYRVQLKQHVKSLQQRWACLRPLNDEQSQQRAELEQQHAQHQQQLLAVLGKLVDKLHAVS
jgi:FtsZ-binding cell division protein ZapB